ncbi:hypothetical protein B0H21DRAFT_702299 [Amylocystis lapponica]|nr:hypothetical protein B0H21DRAFT_702299 [Amylocystis lapponica]
MYLKLATAMKILTSSSLDEAQLQRGDRLLSGYLLDFKELYGQAALKPNHHYSMHVAAQIRDFGPVYNFWAFLPEHLNKVLKGFHLNNWSGGELEVSMMRAFLRSASLHNMISTLSAVGSDPSVAIAKRLLQENQEARGTVEAVAASGEVYDDGESQSGLPITLGSFNRAPALLTHGAKNIVFNYYKHRHVEGRPHIYSTLDSTAPQNATFFNEHAQTCNYILIDGRRLTPHSQSPKGASSSAIVKTMINNKMFAGEVVNIFHHTQRGIEGGATFAEMIWLRRLDVTPVVDDPWFAYPELEVECWEYRHYLDKNEPGVPPAVIPVSAIHCQLARGECHSTKPKMWITTTLERVRKIRLIF